MRTPQELMEKADEILLKATESSYGMEAKYWAANFAAAHVTLAMGISAIGAIDRSTSLLDEGDDYVGPV